jgi:tetratricopeptide (TPR) repeat protein
MRALAATATLVAACLLAGSEVVLAADGAVPTGFEFDLARSPLSPALHAKVVEVLNHVYSFEFEAAARAAEAIRAADPGDPTGEFLLAETYWWQSVNNRDRPELSARFREHIEATVALAERRLEQDEHDAISLFFLGSGHGRKAIMDGLDGRRFESVNTSVKARRYLKLLNRYHPEIEDAYLGLGLYDYFASQLPWFARILSKLLLGLGGDRERGVAELERAATRGLFTRVEARVFLAIAYLDTEGRYEEALGVLKDLNARYPANLDFYGMLAFAYRTRYDYANAIHMLQRMVERGASEPAFGRQSRQMTAYFLASTYKVAGEYDLALPVLDELVADFDPRAEWLAVSSLIERGRIHDLKGQRARAVADYERVLELKDFRGSRAKAKGYITAPYAMSAEERSHHLAHPPGGSGPVAGEPVASDAHSTGTDGSRNTP